MSNRIGSPSGSTIKILTRELKILPGKILLNQEYYILLQGINSPRLDQPRDALINSAYKDPLYRISSEESQEEAQ